MKILTNKKQLHSLAVRVSKLHNSYVSEVTALIKDAAADCYEMNDDDAYEVLCESLMSSYMTADECEDQIRRKLQREANIVESNGVIEQIEELNKKLAAINARE